MAFVSSVPLSVQGAWSSSSSSLSYRRRPARGPRMTAAGSEEVPDMAKRKLLNVILFGTTTAAALATARPFGSFFVPVRSGATAGSVIAKDAIGNNIKKDEYIKSHAAGSRELAEGLRGDATYLIVNSDKSDLEHFALNAICTHLGCVVPWNVAANKFICPCHGSQYSPEGCCKSTVK